MKLTPKSLPKIISISIIIILISWVAYTLYKNTTNYAEDVAKPIEQSLIDAGATKVCSNGSGGHGLGSDAPWYSAVFETSLNATDATQLVKQVALSTGYHNLQAAESAYPEIHPYYDNSVQNTNSAVRAGSIQLGLSLYDGGEHLSCQDHEVQYNSNHTAIKLNLALPELK